MITCDRPYAFYFLLIIIPALAVVVYRYRALVKSLGGIYRVSAGPKSTMLYRRLKISLVLRTLMRSVAWASLVFAYAGLSWGTAPAPVQKSGNAICFVFDISYSMCAADTPGGRTRLESARLYADQLLLRMPGTSVAVVLAKGDGVLAVPLTEDTAAVESLFDSLSPELMTSAGSGIGKGIEVAVHSFPTNSAQAASVWVLTDGDETDSSISSALSSSVQYGIPVTFIGFGSVDGTEVTAGDGVTRVTTYLREEKLKSIVEEANKKQTVKEHFSLSRKQPVRYIAASSNGSAVRVLSEIRSRNNSSDSDDTAFTYEMNRVPRHSFFILVAIVFFVFSFVVGEIVLPESHKNSKKLIKSATTIACFFLLSIFISCSGRTKECASVLKSTWAWYQEQYQSAVAGFLNTYEEANASGDKLVQQYALYGLAVTYMTQEENDAATERLAQIADDAPQQVKYAAYYDAGIIANRKGDYKKAASLFKQAILADGTKNDAKINLELSRKQEKAHDVQNGEQKMNPVSEENDESVLEKAVFSVIRENEQKKWKNSQSGKKDRSIVDY